MRFTKASVESLVMPPGKGEHYVWDEGLKGLAVKLNPGGSRNYLVQYRDQGGSTRRVVIGKVGVVSLDDARKHARVLLSKVQTGTDPHAERMARRAQAAITLEFVAEAYLRHAQAKLRPRSYEQVERHLNLHWQPLARLPVNAIKRADVAAQLQVLSAGGHRVNANRARSALSALFAWAVGEGIAETNPVIGTNKPAEERSRERVLTKDEIRAVWLGCRDDAYGRIVRLLLLTGQRRDEVGSLADAELDLAAAIWAIPSERTKNGLAHDVPLSAAVLETLAGQPRIEARGLVFGLGQGGFSGWSNSKARLDKRIAAAGLEMPPWRIHDLRRTAATGMANLGVLPHVIEAVLNHVSGSRAGVAGIYNRASYSAEKRAALDLWAAHVTALAEQR